MILDKTFPPDPMVENEAKQLIYNGHKINLFCLNFTNQKSNELINGINIYRYKFSKKLHDKLSPLAYTFPFYHWLLGNKIKKFIKSTDLDAIHIHDMIAAEPVFKLSEPIPKILDLHENRPEIMKSYTHITTGMGKLLINLAKWKRKEFEFVKKAERTIVVTPEAKQ